MEDKGRTRVPLKDRGVEMSFDDLWTLFLSTVQRQGVEIRWRWRSTAEEVCLTKHRLRLRGRHYTHGFIIQITVTTNTHAQGLPSVTAKIKKKIQQFLDRRKAILKTFLSPILAFFQ